jgi:hypothetical protein
MMDVQVLEGTLSEIQQRLGDLPFKSHQRLRVTIRPASEPLELPAASETFSPTEFRNGVPLLPRREVSESVDLDLVKRLLDAEDLELLRADRTAGR